jgi:hypothetical protein
MAKIRISELPELTSGSINTILVGNDNNVTYKIPLTVLTASVVQLLSQSTDARLDLLEQFESEFLPFSSSVHQQIIDATNEQSLAHLASTGSFNAFTSSYINDSASFDDRIKSGSVVAGTISSSAQISALGFITGVVDIDNYVTTASYNLDSASFNTRIENATNEQYLAGFATTQSVNDLSTSIDSRLDTLESFSSSADSRYVLSGSITQTTWDNISGKPNNLVSSSTQITEYGFISESVDISSLNSFTQSAEQRISDLEAATASYLTSLDGAISNSAQVDYNYILNTPNNIISSSTQISELGFVTGAYVTINEYNSLTQSFNQITESYYTLSGSFGSIDFSGINAITESYLLFTQSYYSASASVDSRLNALETAIDDDSMYLTTSSFEAYTQSIDNRVSGLEAQTSSYLTSLDGAITSSQQIADLGFITGVVDIDNYVTTASYNLDSASFSSRILAATNEQFLGGFATTGSNIFTGNQTISASLYVSGTTELGGNIIPATPRGATLGTSERPFADIFIQSASIHIQSDISGTIDTTLSNVSGNIQISAGGMQLLGSGSFNAASASLNYISGNVYFDILQNSLQNFSSSLDSRILAATNEQNLSGFATTSSLNNLSTSVDSRLDLLESFSSSADGRYVLSGSITQTTWDNIANKPNDIISSSLQISALGFITGVVDIDNYVTTASYNTDSASFDTRIKNATNEQYILGFATTSSLEVVSASAWGAFQSASSYSSSLATSISASNYTITINSASVSSLSSSIYLTDVTQSSNFTTLSSSVDSRLDVVEATASLFTPFSTSVDSRLDNQEAFSSSLSVIANSSTKIVDSAWAGAGSWTGTYTGNGGKVLVTAYASGYVGSTGLYSLSLTRDGIVVDTNSFYYNQASTHMVLPPLNYVGYNETGSHTYAIVLNGGIVQDSGDNGTIVVTETFNTLNAGLISSSAQITALGFVSSSTGTPAGTISSSAQIESLGYALTSSVNNLSASIYLTDSTQSNNIVINSASAWGAYTSASAYSASAAATYAIKGGDATFNNLTATTFILSSSVYYVTASYSSGSTIFGNTSDDTHQFTGSVSISGSLTASLSNGYFWVGNSSNKTYEVPTSSFTTTASFNSFTSSYYIDSASAATARNTTSASLASLQLSLGTTSVPFSASSVVNPSSYVLVTYYTASYNGGTMDLIAVDTVNNKATSTNYQFVNAGNGTGIAQNGKASSGAGAPNPALSSDIVSGSVRLKVSDTGTFTFKGVIRLF